jgi:hypothetical protein
MLTNPHPLVRVMSKGYASAAQHHHAQQRKPCIKCPDIVRSTQLQPPAQLPEAAPWYISSDLVKISVGFTLLVHNI